MLREDDIRFVKETVVPHATPLLSLYVDVNLGRPENARRAWLPRVKNTLKELQVPRDITAKVIDVLESRRPDARTYVVFAASDFIRLYSLHVDPPVVNLAHGRIEGRWGDPYVFPLLYIMDEYQRYGVVFIDHKKWRFFEVFLGDIEEIGDAFLDLGSLESHKIDTRPAALYQQEGVLLRGGARGDQFERHIEAWVQRFYKRAALVLQKLVEQWRIDVLILIGPDEDTHFFVQNMPKNLRQRTVARVPSLPNPGASAGEVLKHVAPAIADSMQAQELALLQEVREKGRWGPGILQQLQMGRLHLVVAPWNLNGSVWRCAGGLVVKDPKEAEAFCPGQEVKEVPLREVLPDLLPAYGARLEFVQGQAEQRLLAEFEGLAGLPRW